MVTLGNKTIRLRWWNDSKVGWLRRLDCIRKLVTKHGALSHIMSRLATPLAAALKRARRWARIGGVSGWGWKQTRGR